MNTKLPHTTKSRSALVARSVAVGAVAGLAVLSGSAFGAVEYAGKLINPVVIGNDDDNTANPIIQPEGVAANQSLRNSDFLIGGKKGDVLIGRTGPDVLLGNYGDDVLVGGLERGSDVEAFPNFDTAHGGKGDDFFIWAPGDGSDAFVGGEDSKWYWKKVKRTVTRDGKKVKITKRVKKRRPQDEDRLLVGLAVPSVSGDNTTPELFPTKKYGEQPRVNISGAGLGPTTGDNPAQPIISGSCEVVRAPAGLGYSHLVRFFRDDNGAQAVTIRVKQVESVYCKTRGSNTITEFNLGPKGNSEVEIETTDFRVEPGTLFAELLAGDPAANADSAPEVAAATAEPSVDQSAGQAPVAQPSQPAPATGNSPY